MIQPETQNRTAFSHERRILGQFYGTNKGPTVVIFAGIHGNEKAGVHAADKVIHRINESHIKLNGNLHFILGNINALNKGLRFENEDLNRVWQNDHIVELETRKENLSFEEREQRDILQIIRNILNGQQGPFYFLDLHTTSSSSVPFITISDSLNNRKFSSHFPIPVVLGIEEYLDGPLLTYINEYGHIALGFEGGAHEAASSIINCEAFIWKALVHSKCMQESQLSNYKHFKSILTDLACEYKFFAIKYRYELKGKEQFAMKPGFENFERIRKNDFLAKSNGHKIVSPRGGRIFMPLYQELGEDGFFILKKVSKFWLGLSIVARKLKFNHFLRLIPGVRQDPENNYTLIVNPHVARFMTRPIFHLFGYRQQIYKDDKLHFIKRDRKIKSFL
ncbi:MAG: succinylglutamate desuccinylase/aspartoacylase family protein [Flavobacteriales bacterium]|nr:succinylglutamate desuccinylase/aspartoacylase family protein [Flavobacteriales bacterium]